MKEKICGVYGFKHIPTGKWYVGSGVNIYKRKADHGKHSRTGTGTYFQVQLFKLGLKNFSWEILEICDRSIRLVREKFFIDDKNSVYPNGFNLIKDPTKGLDYVFTDEIKARLSDAMTGRKLSPEFCKNQSLRLIGNNYALGNILSEETRKKMSISKMGHKPTCTGHSLETRLKMSKSHTGKKLSEITKSKLVDRMKGNKFSLGKRHSEESKLKMSLCRIGKKLSLETILKIKNTKRLKREMDKSLRTP